MFVVAVAVSMVVALAIMLLAMFMHMAWMYIVAVLLFPMDRHSDMCTGDPTFHTRLGSNPNSWQPRGI